MALGQSQPNSQENKLTHSHARIVKNPTKSGVFYVLSISFLILTHHCLRSEIKVFPHDLCPASGRLAPASPSNEATLIIAFRVPLRKYTLVKECLKLGAHHLLRPKLLSRRFRVLQIVQIPVFLPPVPRFFLRVPHTRFFFWCPVSAQVLVIVY